MTSFLQQSGRDYYAMFVQSLLLFPLYLYVKIKLCSYCSKFLCIQIEIRGQDAIRTEYILYYFNHYIYFHYQTIFFILRYPSMSIFATTSKPLSSINFSLNFYSRCILKGLLQWHVNRAPLK